MIDEAIRVRRELVKERSLSFSLQNRRNKGCSSPRAVLEQEIHQRHIGKREGKTSDRSRSNLKLIPIIWEIRDCITFLKWGWNRKREPSMAITTSWETYINIICRLHSIFLNQYKYKHLPLRIFSHHLVVHFLEQSCHTSARHHTCPPGDCFTDIPGQ